MKLLAFDTSTERLAIALAGAGAPQTLETEGGARSSSTLLPQIAAMLARAGLTWSELDTIAFGRGPGAFTGLRTSCAVAQGLAFGLGCPVLPIDSLLVVAEDARAGSGAAEVAVAMDARMGEVYAARYRWHEEAAGADGPDGADGADGAAGRWEVLDAPALYALPALADRWRAARPDLVAGSALAAFGADLFVPPDAHAVPQERERGAALLRLALAAAAAGAGVDAAAALPLYLRDKVALTTAERSTSTPAAVQGAGAHGAATRR